MNNKHQILALLQRNNAAAELIQGVEHLTASAKDDGKGHTTINTLAYNALLATADHYREVIAATYPAAFKGDTPDSTIDIGLYNNLVQCQRDLQAALTWQRAVPLDAIATLANQSTLAPTPAIRSLRAWIEQQ